MTDLSAVAGVPLEPGERVVFYLREEPGWQKWLLIGVGVLTSWAIVGLFFLAAGVMATTEVYAATTRRVLLVSPKRVQQLRLEHLRTVTRQVKGGSLRWLHLEGGGVKLSVQASVAPGLVALVERLAGDPRALERQPTVEYDGAPLRPHKRR